VYPGAPELCATVGTDNDCDGNSTDFDANAPDTSTFYLDADADGYGDSSQATQSCASPGPQWVTQGGDGCPSDPGKTAPGTCGCGVTDTDTDLDTVADCIDNCPQAPNATQSDCNSDGVGDACSMSADCNMNGIPDTCDIASGQSADADGNGVPDGCQVDCNGNGIPDDLEIVQGDAPDCDDNGIPDECGDGSVVGDTGDMGPVGAAQDSTGTLVGQTPSSTLVQVRVQVRGDLGDISEFLSLLLNGVAIGGDLFKLDGSECPPSPNVTTVVIPPSQWDTVLAAASVSGTVQVRLASSATVSAPDCSSGSSRVTVTYSGTGYDCDGDGQPDTCQLDAGVGDCDDNGVFDACEAGGPGDTDSDGTPDSCERAFGDVNLDNRIDGVDLAFLLTRWGQPNPIGGDLDGDGDVDAVDLSFLLARWGPVL
jgi:hypothetical protein